MPARCAIFVDFDNVFTTLWGLDRNAALRFASEPADWLQVLANSCLTGEPRRWLVARCYLNPAGYAPTPGEANDRLYFSRFRPSLVRAGFEVIDCPVVSRGGKNAADIRMVVDALDLLGHRTHFDEFVLASGDSDFTPLLQRLRAEDRRITIIS
ncbi:MAG: NYN domain-containing protein, partial [Chthoniobacter sp.]|nr:NYN domain-containing protein [Chthoniobacter sp.]